MADNLCDRPLGFLQFCLVFIILPCVLIGGGCYFFIDFEATAARRAEYIEKSSAAFADAMHGRADPKSLDRDGNSPWGWGVVGRNAILGNTTVYGELRIRGQPSYGELIVRVSQLENTAYWWPFGILWLGLLSAACFGIWAQNDFLKSRMQNALEKLDRGP